jgi:hypothetical protein
LSIKILIFKEYAQELTPYKFTLKPNTNKIRKYFVHIEVPDLWDWQIIQLCHAPLKKVNLFYGFFNELYRFRIYSGSVVQSNVTYSSAYIADEKMSREEK